MTWCPNPKCWEYSRKSSINGQEIKLGPCNHVTTAGRGPCAGTSPSFTSATHLHPPPRKQSRFATT